MKITKEKLNKIIKEEIEAVLDESGTISEIFGFNKLKKLSDKELNTGMLKAIRQAHSDKPDSQLQNHPLVKKWVKEYTRRNKKEGRSDYEIFDAIGASIDQAIASKNPKKPSAPAAKPTQSAPRKYIKPWDDKSYDDWREQEAQSAREKRAKEDRLAAIDKI